MQYKVSGVSELQVTTYHNCISVLNEHRVDLLPPEKLKNLNCIREIETKRYYATVTVTQLPKAVFARQ